MPPPDISNPPYYAWTSLGTLNSGEQVNVTITVSVDSGSHLDVVTNQAMGESDITQPYPSNEASFTILVPGADITKSANRATADIGDTITYTLSYQDQRLPAADPIAGLNLRVRSDPSPQNANGVRYRAELTNNSGGDIDLADCAICLWIYDSAPAGNYTVDSTYGGGALPWWAGWSSQNFTGSATAVGPWTLPSGRQANRRFCWNRPSSITIPDGYGVEEIDLHINRNDWSNFDSHGDDYSQDVGAGRTNDYHFALYYQGTLVKEDTGVGVDDPQTGCEPYFLQLSDTLDSALDYISSNPPGTWDGTTLRWEYDCVRPSQIMNFEVVARVNGSAIPGSTISNTAAIELQSGPGISVPVTVVVNGATLTPTPIPSSTSTPTPAGTPTFTPTASSTPTPMPSATATASPTPLPSATPTPAPLKLHPLPPSPHPGTDKGIWIAYYISAPADIVIEVYTLAGEKIKTFDPVFKQAGNNEQFWDALNDFSKKVATGGYPYRVIARSPSGEEEWVWGKLAIVR